ncbi:MAG: hypothetical protein AMJ68_06545 [Acidithiobacillales bacterium SG8_45]|jgi:hypothetical protein|nr:MAG: hypothetical protein AMJ68_06545 [Acidithiobacillales bacterium SG8_45]
MQTTVTIEGKSVNVETSRAADLALQERKQPLLAEMELYFSCLIRKQVRFREAGENANEIAAGDQLAVRFRPVMTAKCDANYEGDSPPLADFPIVKPTAYVPHWLRIDFRHGKWIGEFGYNNRN